jgi:hypothetical protein
LRPITFLFGLHNHQPVGNFDFVIEQAYERAYRPFLDVLERHPGVRLALHNSGILLDWFRARRPEYLERVARLAAAGRVEPIGGGFYEPILPVIPDADKIGQIRKMSDRLEADFGARPTGLWLAERVWEPGLVEPLARAGVRYVMVDDAHFLAADQLWNWWLTEDQGATVGVWPISRRLRYLVPFEPPAKTIEFLRELAAGGADRVALLADDGEKFGVWPDTYRQVYEEGWLEQFFCLLEENAAWLRMALPGETTAARAPEGRIYLPTASYAEMMEWALPAPAQRRFHKFSAPLEASGAPEARFVRGGFWRNFLAKYPESNLMHQRLLDVRGRLGGAEGPALDDLWQAECNCAYWHGVFGGLYLPHLREGVYRKILSAERRIDEAAHGAEAFLRVDRSDVDRDGFEEIRVVNGPLGVLVSPERGGAIEELDYFPRLRNLSHGLTRRPEAYHAKLREPAPPVSMPGAGAPASSAAAVGAGVAAGPPHANGDAVAGSVRSIHDRTESKEAGLAERLHYDWYRRLSLIDHLFRDDATPGAFERADYGEQGDFIERSYDARVVETSTEVQVVLERTGVVWIDGRSRPIRIEKRLHLAAGAPELVIDYRLATANGATARVHFGVEFNFTMLAGNSTDRFYRVDGAVPAAEPHLAGRGAHAGVRRVALHDDWERFAVELDWSRPAGLWRFPIETISQSESGFERVYQGSCVVPHWVVTLAPDRPFSVRCHLRLLDTAATPAPA